MHPSFGSMKTDSGRTLCKRPNLQNTPTRNYGLAKNFPKMIKSCISTPDNDNYYLVTVDYAALEARLASLDSEDPVLLETFNEENADFHSRTSWVTFFKDKETEVEEIEVECNGKIYKYLGDKELGENKRSKSAKLRVFVSQTSDTSQPVGHRKH